MNDNIAWPDKCVAIEVATGGVVNRRDLRPNDWWKIWPELADGVARPCDEAGGLAGGSQKQMQAREG